MEVLMERTLILIKPDAMKRNLACTILSRFENAGLKIAALKMLNIDNDLAHRHYAEHIEKPFFPSLLEYITSCPVIAVVFQGDNAVQTARWIIGATDPAKAEDGTIRKDFGLDGQRNSVHGSDSVETAQREIALYFSDDELFEYQNS
jgi:nucleoside-diphosphate kinase